MEPLVKIVRLEQTHEGAIGSMVLDNRLFCTTLEPDAHDLVRSQIPEGVYLCKRFHGTKYPDTYEIIVPGHSAVLYHAGNIEEHSTMCVLLGQYPDKLTGVRAVLNSGKTFELFMEIMRIKKYPNFILQIKDQYKGGLL